MKTEEQMIENVVVLKLFDQINMESCAELKGVVSSKVSNNQVKLLLDFTNVESIDSSGLGMLISCQKYVKEAGGSMKISQLHNGAKNTFYVTRMDRVFEIFDNNELALDSFR